MAREKIVEVPAITMANTKKEMLDAYHQMKDRLRKQEEHVLNAAKLKEKLKREAAAEVAAQVLEKDPIDHIRELQAATTRKLTELAEQLGAERNRYSQLCEAVANKKKELETIYEVESAAGDLVALIETQRQQKVDFESSMAQEKEELESALAEMRARLENEKSALERRNEELRRDLDKQRKRDKEEYEYATKREREQRKNALEDEMAQLSKETERTRQEFEQEITAQRAALDKRERLIAEREAIVSDLQQNVDSFPKTLETKVQAAVAETTARVSAEYEHKLALQSQQFEGEKNVLSGRIEGLTRLVETQREQIDALSKQQEKAYEKVQDIATRAVDRASRFISMPASQSVGTLPPGE